MSQTDLFGNVISTSKPSKKFTLNLVPTATSKDKKMKSKIIRRVKEIDQLKRSINNENQKLENTKSIYNTICGSIKSKLEIKWSTYIKTHTQFLINDELSEIWEKELLYSILKYELEMYQDMNLSLDHITPIKFQINNYSHAPSINPIEEDESIEADTFSNELSQYSEEKDVKEDLLKESINTFKKVYKSLLKQIHPDLLWSNSEDNDSKIKELNHIWEQQKFYELLAFNYKINPSKNLELNTNDLELIDNQIHDEYLKLELELKSFKECLDYIFYIEGFYNTSERVIETNSIHNLEKLQDKLKAITYASSITTIEQLKALLHSNRIELSEKLNIKYLIEDLYFAQK